MTQLGLIAPPEPRDRPGTTAREVKDAIRRHHSASPAPMPGEWTVVEELWGIDVLAWSAWSSSQHRRHGYEVKVSRSDYRRELLKPSKRARALQLCHRFSFAVPAGLLKPEELAYVEPIWDDGAFERVKCPAKCVKASRAVSRYTSDPWSPRRGTVSRDKVPVPSVLNAWEHSLLGAEPPEWFRRDAEARAARSGRTPELELELAREDELVSIVKQQGFAHQACPECDGKGYVKGARVEEEAPTLWVPADVGLVEVHGGGVRIVKRPPTNIVEPLSERTMAEAFRWASLRGDPRHRVEAAAASA